MSMESFEMPEFPKAVIDRGYKKSESLFTKQRIKMHDFADLYGQENVKRDHQRTLELEKSFREKATEEQKYLKKLSVILEALIFECSELNEWLGENVVTIKTSRYDDFENGVDLVAEFRPTEHSASHLSLAIDATFSSEVIEKLQGIKKEIDNSQLSKVKYFISEHVNIRGEISKIPRIVIATSGSTVLELNSLWTEPTKENIEKLNNHFVQFQIIDEILLQAKAYSAYAQKNGQEEVARIYQSISSLMEDIKTKRKRAVPYTDKRDSAYSSLKERIEYLF